MANTDTLSQESLDSRLHGNDGVNNRFQHNISPGLPYTNVK
jgi:hypothetical protein